MKIKQGDYIRYKLKNELGVVKTVKEDGRVFAWFDSGDTAASIGPELYEILDPYDVKENWDSFSNSSSYASLAGKRVDILLQIRLEHKKGRHYGKR